MVPIGGFPLPFTAGGFLFYGWSIRATSLDYGDGLQTTLLGDAQTASIGSDRRASHRGASVYGSFIQHSPASRTLT